MKKTNKLSTISIACVACAAVSLPALGAAPVRSLGGAGVYSSASSAASAKTSAAATKTVTAANRGGTLRADTTKTAAPSLRSSTARAAATPRLSIGKYLAGSSALNKVTSKPSGPAQDSSDNTEVLERIDELSSSVTENKTELNNITVNIEQLQKDLEEVLGKDVVVSYENGELTINDTTVSILDEDRVNQLLEDILSDRLKELEDAVAQLDGLGNAGDINIWDDGDAESDKTITAAINKLNTKIVESVNEYIAGENVKIENNEVSVIVGALADADIEPDAIATVGDVKNNTLPQPPESCTTTGSNTMCVLSVDTNGAYKWLELVGSDSVVNSGTGESTVDPEAGF